MSRLAEDPVVALAAPRPDFDGALHEFLIGLLTVSLQPADEQAWIELWTHPPTPEVLQTVLDELPAAFDLDGEGPRFFQDLSASDFTDVEPGPIAQILIETPGDQTIRLNKDLFIKRERVEQLGRPAAAMALLTLQTYAPAGGQGHRTSLRGGGPLTTLVDPRVDAEGISRAHEQPLWRKLWANVETSASWGERASPGYPAGPSAVFPWLAATRISKGNASTSPTDGHPLQVYFGLPRRVRLEFGSAGRCDLTGIHDDVTVTGFRMRNYGVQYVGWQHPLSPYYQGKSRDEWLPVHGQPGGVGWRDWLGFAMRAPTAALRRPASVVAAFGRRGTDAGLLRTRIHAFGYSMDKMKARGWTDAAIPAFVVEETRQALLYQTASRFTEAAGMAATALSGAVKTALFRKPDEATGDLGQVRQDLWAATERDFYDLMSGVADPGRDDGAAERLAMQACQTFAVRLLARATDVFDVWCPASGVAPEAIRRIVSARYNLVVTLRGYSKLGRKLFEMLGVAPPTGGSANGGGNRSRKEAAT